MKRVLERFEGEIGDIQLQDNNGHFEIIASGVFLMSTASGESEKEMVRLAIEQLKDKKIINVLIGGLGVGYSVMEALEHDKVKFVEIVEIEEAIIKWNEKYFSSYNNNVIFDSRVNVFHNDLLNFVEDYRINENFDLIVLDVDNGPDWLVREENKALYGSRGLQILKEAITPGGIIVAWSATKNTSFKKEMKSVFSKAYIHELELFDQKKRPFKNYLYFGIKA